MEEQDIWFPSFIRTRNSDGSISLGRVHVQRTYASSISSTITLDFCCILVSRHSRLKPVIHLELSLRTLFLFHLFSGCEYFLEWSPSCWKAHMEGNQMGQILWQEEWSDGRGIEARHARSTVTYIKGESTDKAMKIKMEGLLVQVESIQISGSSLMNMR